MLHGSGGNGADLRVVSGMSAVADRDRFIVVYAEGSHGHYGVYPSDWNAGGCCGAAAREEVDDLAFMRQIVNRVSAEFAVDAKRVFLAGFSDGGRLPPDKDYDSQGCAISARIGQPRFSVWARQLRGW